VLFISEKHSESNYKVYSILLTAHRPLSYMWRNWWLTWLTNCGANKHGGAHVTLLIKIKPI